MPGRKSRPPKKPKTNLLLKIPLPFLASSFSSPLLFYQKHVLTIQIKNGDLLDRRSIFNGYRGEPDIMTLPTLVNFVDNQTTACCLNIVKILKRFILH